MINEELNLLNTVTTFFRQAHNVYNFFFDKQKLLNFLQDLCQNLIQMLKINSLCLDKQILVLAAPNCFISRYFFLVQGVAIIENIMDHLATALGMDPLEFRLKNMIPASTENPLPEIIPQLRISSDYENRKKQVIEFNQVS